MAITPELVALISEKVGRFNVDVLAGWEAGLLGKERPYGRKLFDREPPKHLTGTRAADWYAGRDAGYRQKKVIAVRRETLFLGNGERGAIVVVRKGWIARAKVVTQMERAGARGVVVVSYTENGKEKRVVNCMI